MLQLVAIPSRID